MKSCPTEEKNNIIIIKEKKRRFAMEAICKYPGSKWRIADWIINFFPDHHSYLEPFFGSGAVFFKKPRSNIETINDLDGNVVNLFECIKRDPEKLAHEIYYTPYARAVYDKAYGEIPKDPIGKAVNFYVRINMGHGFRTNGGKVGWKNDVQGRERAYAALDWCHLPDKIFQAAERLRGVQIENRPAVDVIQRFNSPKVLVYCDPPYVLSTRHGKQYRCEMDDREHEYLLDVLLAHKGPVVLSGYWNQLYEDRLRNWHTEERISYTQSGSRKREMLWMNYMPDEQQSLLELMGERGFRDVKNQDNICESG